MWDTSDYLIQRRFALTAALPAFRIHG